MLCLVLYIFVKCLTRFCKTCVTEKAFLFVIDQPTQNWKMSKKKKIAQSSTIFYLSTLWFSSYTSLYLDKQILQVCCLLDCPDFGKDGHISFHSMNSKPLGYDLYDNFCLNHKCLLYHMGPLNFVALLNKGKQCPWAEFEYLGQSLVYPSLLYSLKKVPIEIIVIHFHGWMFSFGRFFFTIPCTKQRLALKEIGWFLHYIWTF